MTPPLAEDIETVRAVLDRLEHRDPAEQDALIAAIVADLRSRRPAEPPTGRDRAADARAADGADRRPEGLAVSAAVLQQRIERTLAPATAIVPEPWSMSDEVGCEWWIVRTPDGRP